MLPFQFMDETILSVLKSFIEITKNKVCHNKKKYEFFFVDKQ